VLLKDNKHQVLKKRILGMQLLTTGKVLRANMVGDNTILQAMKSNEIDTNKAYENMKKRKDTWSGAKDVLKGAFKMKNVIKHGWKTLFHKLTGLNGNNNEIM